MGDVLVTDVLAAMAEQTGLHRKQPATLVLPNNHIIGISDHKEFLRELLDSPPATEKRKDPFDGKTYTKHEFYKYYGSREGEERWSIADIDEVEAARAQSLKEIAKVPNSMRSSSSTHARTAGGNL